MRSAEEEHFERHAGYPPESFDDVWVPLKEELNLTDEDLDMPSAVVSYTRNYAGGTDVTCRSLTTGQLVTQHLPIDCTQLMEWHCTKRNVQDQFPSLSVDQREFLLTGISKEEWDDLFKEDDD